MHSPTPYLGGRGAEREKGGEKKKIRRRGAEDKGMPMAPKNGARQRASVVDMLDVAPVAEVFARPDPTNRPPGPTRDPTDPGEYKRLLGTILSGMLGTDSALRMLEYTSRTLCCVVRTLCCVVRTLCCATDAARVV